ncbi:ECF RNA polymerase sigma factor SigW [Planctomycetes bacterium Poly30]|uniref:ECF RNA polymerase sigma factor SigW n=1 Tax=Saltatorellus ferox TaxID=2528018 RepID=A0A518EYH9_9BACT|nr:ECF RNA polymerase sigma factor SigW [Planctomycetes bacterium Poly30]
MSSTDFLTIEDLLEERQWLSRVCHRLVQNAADAEDVVQETMVRALAAPSASSAHEDGRLRSWLATTGRNVAHEMRRRSGRRVARERKVARPEVMASDLDSAMAGAELREQIARLVLALPQAEREAVVLRFYENLSAEDIARRVGASSSGAVRQRIYRGLERLRASLDHEEKEGRRAWLPAALGLARRSPEAAGTAVPLGAGWGAWWVAAAAALLVALGIVVSLRWNPDSPVAVDLLATSEDQVPVPALVAVPEGGVAQEERLAIEGAVEGTASPGGRRFRILDPTTHLPVEGTDWFLRHTGDLDPQPIGAIEGGYLPPVPPVAAGTTGPDGLIELPPLTLEPLTSELMQLVVETSRSHAGASFAIDGTRAPGEAVDLIPPVGGSLVGVFVDSAGDPIEGAEVAEWTSEERLRTLGTTDENGRFRIGGIAPVSRQFLRRGDGVVVSAWRASSCYFIRRNDTAPWTQIWNLLDHEPPIGDGNIRDVGTVRAIEPVRVRGTVVELVGAPVAGTLVSERLVLLGSPQERLRAKTQPRKPWGRRPASGVVVSGADGHFELELRQLGERRPRNASLIALGPGGTSGELSVLLPTDGTALDPVRVELGTDLAVPLRLLDPARPGASIEPSGEEKRFVAWRALGRDGEPHSEVVLPRLTWLLGGSHVVLERKWLKDAASVTLELEVPGYDVARVGVEENDAEVTVFLTRRERRPVEIRFRGDHVLPGQTASIVVAGEEPSTTILPVFTSPRATRLRGLTTGSHGRQGGGADPEQWLAGGLTMGVKDGDIIEVAWPTDQRGWLVALPDERGPYVLGQAASRVLPRIPLAGGVIELELAPWKIYREGGPPVLEGRLECPVY